MITSHKQCTRLKRAIVEEPLQVCFSLMESLAIRHSLYMTQTKVTQVDAPQIEEPFQKIF